MVISQIMPLLLSFFIFLAVGLVGIRLGYLIKYKNRLELIAGYDPALVKDKKGLGNFVGNSIMRVGGLVILCGLAITITAAFNPKSQLILVWGAVMIMGIIWQAIRVVNGARNF